MSMNGLNGRKRYLTVPVFATMLSSVLLSVSAQELGYGFRAGVNFPNYALSGRFGSDRTVNFHVGGYVDIPLAGDFLSLQPGLSLQGKGAAGGDWFFNTTEPNDPMFADFKQHTMWLDVPVNIVGKLRMPAGGFAFAGVGPYLGFGLSGKNMLDGKEMDGQGPGFKFGKDGSLRGLDYGVNLSLGYQLPFGLQIIGGYGLGLADLAPENGMNYGYEQYNRVWSIGLGYAF